MRLAIHAPNLCLTLPSQPFGKDVANRGLYSALVRYGDFEQITFCSSEQPSIDSLRRNFADASTSTSLSVSPLTASNAAVESGTLLRGQPYLSELAWERSHRHADHLYSLVGLIHTLAPPKVRELIGDSLVAPVQPWDSFVCTSPSVRDCLEGLFDRWESYLTKRLGATQFHRPQLSLLPLGVDQNNIYSQRCDFSSRNFLRSRLHIDNDDLLVLWLWRLSYFEKAYPQAMFIALQKASQRCGQRLHFVMAGWFPGGQADLLLFQEAARHYSPDVSVHFLDGKNSDVVRCCWASADIFLSLVDNPQETFGLTPVEAMAAGLPVVVSDWDGYRYTVSDGVEGYLIPTLSPSRSSQGEELALQHDFGVLSYQDYVGAVAQHVAVDTDAASAAISRLADDPVLRQRMGDAGRTTVKQRFDWKVVAGLHHQLFLQLEDRRRAAYGNSVFSQQHPLRSDPFKDFAPFATECLQSDTHLSLSMPLDELRVRLNNLVQLDCFYAHLHSDSPDLHQLLLQLRNQSPCSLEVLLRSWPPEMHDDLKLSITWLAKLGFLTWFNPSSSS